MGIYLREVNSKDVLSERRQSQKTTYIIPFVGKVQNRQTVETER